MNEKFTGSLFRSQYKYDFDPDTGKYVFKDGANPKAADYTGTIQLTLPNGELKLRLSGWVRGPQNGKQGFLSLSVDYPRDEMRRLMIDASPTPASNDVASASPVSDEDLPF